MVDADDIEATAKLRRYAKSGAHVGYDIEGVVAEWKARFTQERGEPPTSTGEYFFRWHVQACREVLERLDAEGRRVH